MIIYVAVLTALLSLLVLALIYLADLWERGPLDLLQNAFLSGLATLLVLVLAFHRLTGIEAWTGGLYVVTLAALAAVLPALLADDKEIDERFDGIVYAVAFGVGAASVVHLFNLPGAAARYPERVVLGGGETPDVRDLLLLISSPGPRGELADLAALLLVAVLAGAVLGTLKLGGTPLGHQVAGTLIAALVVGGAAVATAQWWPARLALAIAAVAVAVALKRRSVFRRRRAQPEREIFLGALKTALMIFGAIVLALAVLMSLTDNWRTAAPPEEVSPIDARGPDAS